METRSKSRILKAKTEVPRNDTKQGDGENKVSPAVLKVTSKEMDPNTQSTRSSVKKSVTSKANSTYQRKLLEAQIKADEELARLMTMQLEMKRKLIENRLALEKAKLEEVYEEDVIEANEESSSEDPKEKVGNWLKNIDRNERKRMSHETSGKGSLISIPCQSQNDKHITNSILLNENTKCSSHDDISGVNQNNVHKSCVESVSRQEMKMLLARQTIEKDLPIFSGEITDWPSFYQQYVSTTKLLGLSDEENMCRLRKALKGDARRSVEGLLLSASSVSTIMDILINKFGRADLIVKSLVSKAKNFPVIRNNDYKSLTHFAEEVSNLVVTLEAMEMLNYLGCPQLLDEMIQKVPFSMQMSWGEKAARAKGQCNLQDFRKWIWEKSEAASYVQSSVNIGKPYIQFSNKDKFKASLVTSQNSKCATPIKCLLCKEGHILEKCQMFLDYPIDEKWNFIKKNGICFSCLRNNHKIKLCRFKKKCRVNNCEKLHHKVLHNETFDIIVESEVLSTSEIVAHTTQKYSSEILLRIVPVIIRTKNTEVKVYALFDEASTVTLMDEEFANSLGIQGEETILGLKWTDIESCKRVNSRKISFDIADKDRNEFYKLENVYTLKNMDLPIQSINSRKMKDKWNHLREIEFESMQNVQPKLLIGQDNWELITSREVIEGPKNSPALSRTKLGWVVHGNLRQFRGRVDDTIVLHIRHHASMDEELHKEVKNFFSTECFGVKVSANNILSNEEAKAEQMMEMLTKRTQNGNRWETGLLWKNDAKFLPDSKPMALKRLYHIEHRMMKNSDFAEKYTGKIEEYLEKGFAKKVKEDCVFDRKWYLPHFGVVNENKPNKMRFVFDAAAKVHGKSLNDFLLKGPDLYNSLVGIIFKFREKPIAFSSDIKDMFHQISIREEDRPGQRFLWRSHPDHEPEIYEMQVMIFGAISSPFCAQYVKNKNALEFRNKYAQAVDSILNRHYMDDYLDSVSTTSEAIKLIQEVIAIHKSGGFLLRGWVSNSKEVFENIPEELRGDDKILKDNISQRILGLKWMPKEDYLSFSLNFHKISKDILMGIIWPTKREVLRVVMSLYDPLGLVGNFVVKAKILLQDIWRSGLDWDDKITQKQNEKWQVWLKDFEKVENLKIPRCYNLNPTEYSSLQLHIFCDSSEQAFSAVGYFRVEMNGIVKISLVMSRTQVAPLKPILTIPRLELQAAVMGCRLAKHIKRDHSLEIKETFFWTDSRIVLCWLKSDAIRFKTFVAHRVSEIQENSNVNDWNWVPSNMNIADEATRNSNATNLNSEDSWFQGPEFLYQETKFWPRFQERKKETECISTEEIKKSELPEEIILLHTICKRIDYLPDCTKFSNYIKLLRSTAYVLRFIANLKKRGVGLLKGELTWEELQEAEDLWCLKVQEDCFPDEMNSFRHGKDIPKNSRLFRLSPCLKNNIIRIRGRIDNSPELSYETKRPIILCNCHYFTRLLVDHYHRKNGHAGLQLSLNELRQKFWILQARKLVSKILKSCNFCKIRRAKPIIPEMGQLPEMRLLRPPRAFSYVGMDYFGPMMVAIGRRREKRYGVLFTCLSIRAIHIELADSLYTDSAILAIRRFIARRGQPHTIWSDNGTNLTSAQKELKNAVEHLDEDLINRTLVAQEINWKFISPASPHFGGAWERMVRSVKNALRVTLRGTVPKQEVLQTLLAEAEHTVNSRPLTYVSSAADDFESLTPNHFLMGTSSIAKPPIMIDFGKRNLEKQWQFSQQLSECFWIRWIREYLPTLIKRSKWLEKKTSLKKNDLVVVMDNKLPRNNWPLGRIVDVFPGRDGMVRVVDVQVKKSIYRRPVAKLCPVEYLEEYI